MLGIMEFLCFEKLKMAEILKIKELFKMTKKQFLIVLARMNSQQTITRNKLVILEIEVHN
jgi:hypothetical protein